MIQRFDRSLSHVNFKSQSLIFCLILNSLNLVDRLEGMVESNARAPLAMSRGDISAGESSVGRVCGQLRYR